MQGSSATPIGRQSQAHWTSLHQLGRQSCHLDATRIRIEATRSCCAVRTAAGAILTALLSVTTIALLTIGPTSSAAESSTPEPPIHLPPPQTLRLNVPPVPMDEGERLLQRRGERIKQEIEQQKTRRPSTRQDPQSSLFHWILNAVVPAAQAAEPHVAGPSASANAEISELARSLNNDPDLIFRYVYDNIAVEWTFGEKKGALGTLLDQSGNAFDQSSLLVALLRAAGYQASYMYGDVILNGNITVPAPTSPNGSYVYWLGTSNLTYAKALLGAGGYQYDDAYNSGLKFKHVWVKVVINGTTYALDPTLKQQPYVVGINLATATGFSGSTFYSNATSGAVVNTNYVEKINETNVKKDLRGYAQTLTNTLKANYPSATTEEIVGGFRITPLPSTVDPTSSSSLAYQSGSPTEWTQAGGDIPIAYRTALRVRILGIDETFYSSEIYGRRFTVGFNGTGNAVLSIDGGMLARINSGAPVVSPDAPASGVTSATIRFSLDQPYPQLSGAYLDIPVEEPVDQTLDVGASNLYSIVNSWGIVRKQGVIERHRKWLTEYQDALESDTSEKVLGEVTTLIGCNWIYQVDLTDRMRLNMVGAWNVRHARVGIAGKAASPYVDLPINHEASAGSSASVFFLGGMISSALEHGVIEQTQPFGAVSTMRLVSRANLDTLAPTSNGKKIFLANSSNLSTVVSGSTTINDLLLSGGYLQAEIDAFVANDNYVLLPQQRNINDGGDWSGYGAIRYKIDSNGFNGSYLISGALSGGFAKSSGAASPSTMKVYNPLPKIIASVQKAADPVEMFGGSYTAESDDITVGAENLPFGISFQRSYSSADRYNTASSVGRGWRHNFDLKILETSSPTQAFGEDSPVDAATMISGLYAINSLLYSSPATTNLHSPARMTIASIAANWLVDQIKGNVLDVDVPGSTQRYVRREVQNGSSVDLVYEPPPGVADVLTVLSGGTGYTLKQKAGPTMTFNGAGQITQWQQPGGGASDNKLTFSYDASNGNRLQSVGSSYDRTLTLSYNGSGGAARVNGVSDGNGRSVSYAYDASGNLSTFTNALGQQSTYQYDTRHRLTKAFSPEYPSNPYVESIYDELDRVKEQLNALGKHSYIKIAGSRGEEVDPLGQSKIFTFDDAGHTLSETDGVGRTTTMLYDGQGRLTERTAPEGNKVKYEYDANHNITKITQVAKPGCTGSCSDIVQQFVYELNPALGHYNKLKQSTDASGRVTDLSYFTGTPNLQKVQQPALTGSGSVRPETNFTYTSKGQLDTVTDAEGRVTKHAYAPSTGLETSVTTDYGTGRLNLVTAQTYDTVGNVASVTDPLSHTTTFTYDAERHRVTSTAPSPFNYLTTFLYDKNGRLFETRAATGNSAQPEQVATTVYSASDKPLYAIDADGNVTAFAYDDADRLIQTTDAEGRVSQQTYTADNRPYETKQVISGTPTTIKTATYTTNGQLYTLKDANNNTTTYAYDGFDRLNKVTYPNTKFETIAYNPTGTISQRVTRNNETTTYAYDELDRQTSEDPPGSSDVIATTYDKSGRVDLVKVNGTTVFDHDYDTAGRQTQVTRSADSKLLVRTLDAAGNRTALTYPGTPTYTVNYSYDEVGRPKQVKENGSTVLATWTYTDRLNGSVTYADTTTETVKTTLTGELAQLTHAFNGETVQFSLFQNRTGQLINQRISLTAYDYAPPGTASHSYTPNTMNQFSSVDSVSQTYDNNGNLTGDGTWTFGFDHANRLTSASKSGTSATYQYDAFGRRERKTVNSTVTKYLSDGPSVVEEYDGSGTRTARYGYLPGIDRPLFMERSGTRYYYHQDGQGSVIALTATNGVVSERYAYSPYGESANTSAAGNPYRYTGREFDAETGLYYYRARYYSTTLGRFLSPDPLGYNDSMGLYAYVGNDPLNFMDPNGLFRDRSVAAFNLFRTENVISLEGSAGAQIGIHGRAGPVAFGAEVNLGSYERSTAFEGRRVTQSFGASIKFDPVVTVGRVSSRSAPISSAPNLVSGFGSALGGLLTDGVAYRNVVNTQLGTKGFSPSLRVQNDMSEDVRISAGVQAFLGIKADLNLSALGRATGGAAHIMLHGD